MDVKSEKVEELINLTDPLLSNDSTLTESGYQNCEENKMEEGLLHSISSMSLQTDSKNPLVYDAKVSEIKSSSIPNVNTSSLMKFDATPFLLASHVNLSSIEVQEKTYSYGSATMLFYEGFPLHLLDFKVRVRFTVNESYAFDDKGRPRFSIAVEPSEAACNVIRKCEDLVRSKAAFNHEVEWLPALKEESGCFMTRMSIGTKQVEGHSIYTTEFYRSSSSGLKALSLGPLHVSSFKSALPHGSIIDAGFGFYVFNFNNRSGVRISAKHITIY
ncbi:hypothetical protein KP509_33G052600 [Ceratopteris richardii]|nr:hypothetical protein KP509_33G052600 [Ceratopteris richardii]